MPDLALAFKLLEEAGGTEVNMHDWLQVRCLCSKKQPSPSEKNESSRVGNILVLLGYLRFLMCPEWS